MTAHCEQAAAHTVLSKVHFDQQGDAMVTWSVILHTRGHDAGAASQLRKHVQDALIPPLTLCSSTTPFQSI